MYLSIHCIPELFPGILSLIGIIVIINLCKYLVKVTTLPHFVVFADVTGCDSHVISIVSCKSCCNSHVTHGSYVAARLHVLLMDHSLWTVLTCGSYGGHGLYVH